MKNPVTPAGIEPATFRFVAQHLNHCAMTKTMYFQKIDALKYEVMSDKFPVTTIHNVWDSTDKWQVEITHKFTFMLKFLCVKWQGLQKYNTKPISTGRK